MIVVRLPRHEQLPVEQLVARAKLIGQGVEVRHGEPPRMHVSHFACPPSATASNRIRHSIDAPRALLAARHSQRRLTPRLGQSARGWNGNDRSAASGGEDTHLRLELVDLRLLLSE